MNDKRVFLIVLDSFGIGEEPDADLFGDVGSNTLGTIVTSARYDTPNMRKLGLFNIEGVTCGKRTEHPLGSFARMQEASMAKDTTAGHWEIAGLISEKPFPRIPMDFPGKFWKHSPKPQGEACCAISHIPALM